MKFVTGLLFLLSSLIAYSQDSEGTPARDFLNEKECLVVVDYHSQKYYIVNTDTGFMVSSKKYRKRINAYREAGKLLESHVCNTLH